MGVLIPRSRIVLSRFSKSAQVTAQMPLRSMNKGGTAHATASSLLHAATAALTKVCNALTPDKTSDIAAALDRWRCESAVVEAELKANQSTPAENALTEHSQNAVAIPASLKEQIEQPCLDDRQTHHAAARALASGAKWLKRADQSAMRRLFSNTPFHGFSRLPSELRYTPDPAAVTTNGISASTSQDSLTEGNAASVSTSADVKLSLDKNHQHSAPDRSSKVPSRQLQKLFYVIDSLRSVDRVTLQRGHHAGLHSGGLTDVLSGAACAFLARIGIHSGIAIQRSRQFSLYMNESWLEMQFNTVIGVEAELGMSLGLGVSDASPLEQVQVRAGATARADAMSVNRERVQGIIIRIPCKFENKVDAAYDARVNKAKETAKQILLMMQESANGCEKPDGHRMLDKLSSEPQFSDVRIQTVTRSTRLRNSSKISMDGGFSIRAARSLFLGAMVRLGLERVWKEKTQYKDPSLQIQKEGRSVGISMGGAVGLTIGDSNNVSAPFEAFGSVQGALAKDEETLHLREVDGRLSPWSFREVAFSDLQSLTTYFRRWCEVQGRPTFVSADHKSAYGEWEHDQFEQLKIWQETQSSGNDRTEYDYTYAIRFRLTPQAVERLSRLNEACRVTLARADDLRKVCEESLRNKTDPALLSLPADKRMSEFDRLNVIDRTNRQALNATLAQLRKIKMERSDLLQSIDSFCAPNLYRYKMTGHKEILGLKMLAGVFSRTAVSRRDMEGLKRVPTLQAYIDKWSARIATTVPA